jgi:Cytochrome c554 and c-prime
MAKPSVRRPTSLFERPGPWIVIFLLIAALALAASFLGIRALQKPGATSGAMFGLIVALGVMALLLIVTTFLYSARKRLLQERLGGTMMAWLRSHVWLGIVALVAALAHAFLFPFGSSLTSGKVTMILLIVLVVSGALWRLVYRQVPPRVPVDVGNLSIIDTRERVEELTVELDKVKVGKSVAFQQAVDDLAQRRRSLPEIERYLSGLELTEGVAWDRAKDLAARLERESAREARQRKYSKFMQGWRAIHLPLAALLLGAVLFHIFDVLNAGQLFASEPDKTFAGQQECATCHKTIVDEWKLSMHRNAQTSSITRAQTPVTLAEEPKFGRACVNCHAPLGVKFTQRAVFPLFRPDPVGNPEGVLEEGVNCVICHTRPNPPHEIDGASDDLEVGERGTVHLGTMFGPPLEDPDPVPNSAHDVQTGFMGDDVSSSQMCSACHNVVVDIDDDGKLVNNANAPGTGAENPQDSGKLEENAPDVEGDLILQTTYNEWEDYVFKQGADAESCVDCHMPPLRGPMVDGGPIALGSVERDRNLHTFVGVDYDLNPGYYTAPGMPQDAMEKVLEERQDLLAQTVDLDVKTSAPDANGFVTATVKLTNLTGHSFPSGFAFARQWWIEISAQTESGDEVCLARPLDLEGNPINSPCASGVVKSPTEELKTCDTVNSSLDNSDAADAAGLLGDVTLNPDSVAPLDDCDPWLTNLQKILTDGGDDGVATEVAFQSFRPNIVRFRKRTFALGDGSQQVMAPLDPDESDSYDYLFDASKVQGEDVDVTATLRLRHLPPYFVKAFDDTGTYAEGISSRELLENMTIVDVASNKPLGKTTTTPSPASFSTEKLIASGRVGKPVDEGALDQSAPASWRGPSVLTILLLIPLAVGVRRGRRYEP